MDEVSSSVNKTKIVYGANLNFSMAERYLPLLIKRGFLEKVNSGNGVMYKITGSGKQILKDYRRVSALF
ncbi:MAG: transcriptional regulator [Candidatus Bathyarchaeota archaeon]|nr:MAG: transcriptional regulator [Candidatus Bathyarchaeota archaeon]